MKKLLPFLIAFTFSVAIKAQSPALTYTNVTGSNSITCSHPTLNYIASVSNYTNGPLTYTWVSPSSSASGTNVTLSNPGPYTLTAFNTANSFSLTQVFAIGSNTAVPSFSYSASTQTLSCSMPGVIVQASSTITSVAFTWAFPGPGSASGSTVIVNTTSMPSNTVIGNYSLTVTNTVTGCFSTTVIPFYQNTQPPTAVITGPSAISCTTPSVNLTNASTSNISSFPHTQPVTGSAWYGPVPQASLANSSTYIGYTSGTYTLVALDQNNGCTSTAFKTVTDNSVYPILSSPAPFNINCPAPTATIYPVITGPTSGFTYSWSAPPTASVSSYTQSTVVVNLPGDYTITVTNAANSCASTTVVSVAVCAGLKQNTAENIGISIFPNPTTDVFTIKMDGLAQNQVIEIYSSVGILVKKQAVIIENSTINLQNEANGVYFIYLKDGEKVIKTAKIMKQ